MGSLFDRPRCDHCRRRFVLTEQLARILEKQSAGNLVAIGCPADNGWHAMSPARELEWEQ